jgi:hypothetical protein
LTPLKLDRTTTDYGIAKVMELFKRQKDGPSLRAPLRARAQLGGFSDYFKGSSLAKRYK